MYQHFYNRSTFGTLMNFLKQIIGFAQKWGFTQENHESTSLQSDKK